jgi:hypothetical protein
MGHAEDGMKEGDYDDDQVDLAEEVETKPPGDHVSHEGNILTSPIQYWYLANLIMGKSHTKHFPVDQAADQKRSIGKTNPGLPLPQHLIGSGKSPQPH